MPRGGAREGAGRKPNTIAKTPKPAAFKSVRKPIAEAVLAGIDEVGIWTQLINCGDRRLSFDVMRYLTDRRDGRPAQQVVVSEEGFKNLAYGNIPVPTETDTRTVN